MAEALKLDITVDSVEAEATLNRLYDSFRKAGDSAIVAAEKVEKFQKSYQNTSATQQAKKELDALSGSTDKVASSTDNLIKSTLAYAAPGVVAAAAIGTLRWADAIGEMAQRTSLTTTQVQQLSKMADKNGSSFGAMASLIQAAENKLASHNKKAEEAVKLMGMAPEALLKLDPLERLRAIAKGLADLEDPAQRSSAEVAILGQKSDASAAALRALADGADKTESALGSQFVASMGRANDAFDTMIGKIKDLGRAMVGLPIVVGDTVGQMGKDSWLGSWFAAMGLHDLGLPGQSGSGMGMPGLPGSPGGGFGMPTPAGAINPTGGNSQSFIERILGIKRPGASGGGGSTGVTPYTSNQWANIQQVLSGGNPMGMGGLGSFPGWATPDPLSASFQGFQGVPFAGAVGMNGAGGGGGFGSFLSKNKGTLGMIAGGLAAQFIPGKVGNFAQGAMSMAGQAAGIGAMFGPHGAAIGAGIGALVGGVSSLFGGGGKAAKNAKNAEISQVFEQFSTDDFKKMQNEAEKFGISMDKALTAKTMKEFGAAVDEVNGKLMEMNSIQAEIDMLTEKTTVGFDQMNAVVKEFGLDAAAMGPAFQQAGADKEIQKIIDALAIMEKGGADMNGVLDGMQEEISKVVQDSMKFGTTIPENMKPWIEKLKDSGKLVDENGNAISSIEGLKFGEKMESEMDKLVRKLDELISKLAGVKTGFDQAAGAASDLNNQTPSGSGYDPGGNTDGGGVGASTGGLIGHGGKLLYFKRGGFVPRGTDTVPAMLTPGEMVISREMVKGIARNGRAGGMGGVNVTVNVAGYLDSPQAQRNLTNLVTEQIRREQSMRRSG